MNYYCVKCISNAIRKHGIRPLWLAFKSMHTPFKFDETCKICNQSGRYWSVYFPHPDIDKIIERVKEND